MVRHWDVFCLNYVKELDDRRIAMELAEDKPVIVNKPWRVDKPGLGKWKGGWLIKRASNGETVTTPVCCGKRYEACCGLHQLNRLYARMVEGMNWEYQDLHGRQSWYLMTWTLRARATYVTKIGGRSPTTWKQHMKRWGIQDVPTLPPEWGEWKPPRRYRWWMSGQFNEFEQVMLWPQMTPQENLSMWTQMFQQFEKEWEAKWGQRMTYCKAWEFTQQGVLHYHAPVRCPSGVSRMDIEEWAREAWSRIRGGQKTESHSVEYGKPKIYNGNWVYHDLLSDALDYALKYTMKNVNADNSNVLNQDRQFFGLEESQDWNSNLRRYSKSNDWIVADIGDVETLTAYYEGESCVFNRPEYRKAYGQMSRILHRENPPKWKEMTEKQKQQIRVFFMFWKPLSESRVEVPFLEWHGEEWGRAGMAWHDPPDGTFNLRFLINGVLRRRR